MAAYHSGHRPMLSSLHEPGHRPTLSWTHGGHRPTPLGLDTGQADIFGTPADTFGARAGTPADTFRTPAGTPADTFGSPAGTPADTSRTPADNFETPAGTPADIFGTPAGTPADTFGELSDEEQQEEQEDTGVAPDSHTASPLLYQFLQVSRFLLRFVLGPGGLREAPEAPGRPTEGFGGPPMGPLTPPGPGQQI